MSYPSVCQIVSGHLCKPDKGQGCHVSPLLWVDARHQSALKSICPRSQGLATQQGISDDMPVPRHLNRTLGLLCRYPVSRLREQHSMLDGTWSEICVEIGTVHVTVCTIMKTNNEDISCQSKERLNHPYPERHSLRSTQYDAVSCCHPPCPLSARTSCIENLQSMLSILSTCILRGNCRTLRPL